MKHKESVSLKRKKEKDMLCHKCNELSYFRRNCPKRNFKGKSFGSKNYSLTEKEILAASGP